MTLEDLFYNGLVPHLGEIGLVVAGIWADAVSTMACVSKYGVDGEMNHKCRKKMQEENPYHYLAKSATTQSLIFAGMIGGLYVSAYQLLFQIVPEPDLFQLKYVAKELPTYLCYVCYGLAFRSFYIALYNSASFLGLHKVRKILSVPINITLAVFDPKGKTYSKSQADQESP